VASGGPAATAVFWPVIGSPRLASSEVCFTNAVAAVELVVQGVDTRSAV
jgi:hypothetical protein